VNDTPPDVERLYRELLLRKSGEERMLMGFRMFEVARALVRAGIGDLQGPDEAAELRVALFVRTYGQDFSEADRARIVAALRGG
jgi:hypothetical protein